MNPAWLNEIQVKGQAVPGFPGAVSFGKRANIVLVFKARKRPYGEFFLKKNKSESRTIYYVCRQIDDHIFQVIDSFMTKKMANKTIQALKVGF